MAKTYNPGRRLPNVPNMVPDVVSHKIASNESVVKIGLQCYDCHLVEEPVVQLAATILHHRVVDDGYRRCQPCRIKRRESEYPDCICHMCREDTK